jgi:voltage-gated potassium channel
MTLRQRIAFYLNDIQTLLGVGIDFGITALVLLSSIIFVAETYPLPIGIVPILDWINNAILILFAVEYGLRLWSAEDRWGYFFSLFALIDLLSILPFFLGVFDISFIRIFRWFRILRLIRFLELSQGAGKVSAKTIGFVRVFFTLFAIVFVYSGFIYQVEHSVNPRQFATFLDAFYFSIVTMTTVGFGDISPISEAGRLLTVLMILTGIALIPWQVGDLIRQLVRPSPQTTLGCLTCQLMRHDLDASYCKRCGTALATLSSKLPSS